MRDHLATLIDDFRRFDREIAVVRYAGNRRRVTTYGELARLAGRFAALLEKQGIRAGDRVLLWGENSAEWMAAFYGCMLRGVLSVPLDAAGTADFAARVAADVRPRLAVGDSPLLAQLPAEIQKLSFENWSVALPAEAAGVIEGLSAQTPLEILFTSGTTGDPKGIVLTHGNILASIGPIEEASQPYLRYERLIHPLRILNALPLSHVFGQTMGLWIPPIYTAEVHFENRLVAPRLVETIRQERISVLAAVPRVLALLKTHLEGTMPGLAQRVAEAKIPGKGLAGGLGAWMHFRKVHAAFGHKFWALISGGGALPPALEKFWNTVGFVLVQGYGMTETAALVTLNHPFHVAQGTIGKPLKGREVKLGPDGEVLVRGASISGATWQGGALKPRQDEWLATGDIAEMQESGELKFLGRKSEVIVTAAGLNIYPEDLEAAIEQQPGVAACAVVPMETAAGPEPCAVLAVRGQGDLAGKAIEKANERLADFQKLRKWVLWPEPDLPRTSTGKVRRKAVAAWLSGIQRAAATTSNGTGSGSAHGGAGAFGAHSDWLLTLIAQVTGEPLPGVGDELRLTEDLHLDSLGRVQLAAAIEERLGTVDGSGLLEQASTLGELRRVASGEDGIDGEESQASNLSAEFQEADSSPPLAKAAIAPNERNDSPQSGDGTSSEPGASQNPMSQNPMSQKRDMGHPAIQREETRVRYLYPKWPWTLPFRWARAAFVETVIQPLVWLLAKPQVVRMEEPEVGEPILIIANHITAFDAPLIEYSLPGRMRRRMAIAMSGEMLEDFRHFRDPDTKRFFLFGFPAYWLVTALYNVFPLPRLRDFQPSFAHAGKALDRGFNVMVFPEGARSEGKLARFRPGIGLLVKESQTAVLPVAICGLGELKAQHRGWFRSGKIQIRVGRAIRFGPEESEAAITAQLQEAVEGLMMSEGLRDKGLRD
jgi:long-chain acyl-CoA synthetase